MSLNTFANNNTVFYYDDIGNKPVVVIDATERYEMWAFIYRTGYTCQKLENGSYDWVKNGYQYLKDPIIPWLVFEQHVQYKVERSALKGFLGDLTNLSSAISSGLGPVGTAVGIIIDAANKGHGSRISLGLPKTTEVIPLPDTQQDLGTCDCNTEGLSTAGDTIHTKLMAGGVEVNNLLFPID